MISSVIPVILSGGSGSRLWPVSRQTFPKQFCELLDETLYMKTVRRVLPFGSPWTVTCRDLKVLTERNLKTLDLPVSQVLYEPVGRNTAPAIALLCHAFSQKGWHDEIVGIFPADHLIEEEEPFAEAVQEAVKHAERGEVVTLGVRPTHPTTSYGYIEIDKPIQTNWRTNALHAVGFREKPNESTAREFIKRGNFYWNAGMFIFKCSTMMEHLASFAPDIWESVKSIRSDFSNLDEVYGRLRSVSIDYAVLERLTSHVCVPCEFAWSDLGTWDSIAEILAKNNQTRTTSLNVGGDKNFVYSGHPLRKIFGFVGVSDLIVVDTNDAVLIAKRGATERVKEVVDGLKQLEITAATQHTFEVRPWGRFDVLQDSSHYKSKTITVDRGAQLSYQSHEQRAEHWIIVKGRGEVVIDDEVISVQEGQHIHVPAGAKHRIRNTGSDPLEFIEVQLGNYFGEDDIVRYHDDYDRVAKNQVE